MFVGSTRSIVAEGAENVSQDVLYLYAQGTERYDRY